MAGVFNLTDNKRRFDSMIYNSRPVKFSEYISDKYNIVHRQLYEQALNRCITALIKQQKLYISIDEFKRTHRCTEITATEYWKPSWVVIISKKYPFTKKTYSLAPYWNWNQSKVDKNIENLKIDNETNDWEIIYMNYLTGKATLQSRLTEKEIEVDFDYINEATKVSDDYTLKNTFIYKL